MASVRNAVIALFFLGLTPALAAAQEASVSWLDGEALMLDMLSGAALDQEVLEHFQTECRIAMDSVMARHVGAASAELVREVLRCREPRHWEGVRRYVNEFRMRNDTAARFMRPSGIGAPWMVRYAVRCRHACRDGTVGFEIRFTYNGRRVIRVELQAR